MKTMRLPSRRIPPLDRHSLGVPGYLVLACLASALAYLIHSGSALVHGVIAASACVLFIAGAFHTSEKRRFQALADTRKGESICEFARSFNARETDTWVIRAVHKEMQHMLRTYVDAFPVRASDVLLDDLHIDAEDVEDLIMDIARRSGHSIEKPEDNPYYGRVQTVRDLVLFLSAQPRHV